MKKILVIVFLILLTLKLASIGIMANASWWVVFAPLIVIGVLKAMKEGVKEGLVK
ncbi:hypothetical protein [Enterobacter asburiae]|uniref:hypothetical protein n=1 Tax=Enterobacter asburiae TaxID=61645 RepID=UPI003D6F6EDB